MHQDLSTNSLRIHFFQIYSTKFRQKQQNFRQIHQEIPQIRTDSPGHISQTHFPGNISNTLEKVYQSNK